MCSHLNSTGISFLMVIICGHLIHNSATSIQEQVYKRSTVLDNQIDPTLTSFHISICSKIKCSVLCRSNPSCFSIIFNKITCECWFVPELVMPNVCNLHNDWMESQSSFTYAMTGMNYLITFSNCIIISFSYFSISSSSVLLAPSGA